VPTEVNSSWAATGDDATRGFLWTYQKYDWMNRVVRKINTDGDDSPTWNPSDVLISYEGCGCAGATVTTVEGELVPRTDTTGNARRKQKLYNDILGRTFKTETFEWDGTTVYSTIVNTYNGRDQLTLSRHYAGSTSSSTYQDTTATFDGHGRLLTRHIPQQSANTSTGYEYNPDDSFSQVTDARGAATNYVYNSRGLVAEISHTVPENSQIPASPVVEFDYDAVGNRVTMEDGLGTVTYSYNTLSQLTAEIRNFTDTLSAAPETNNGYKFEYTYHLGGPLKTLKEPFGAIINYGLDKIGRLTSVAPSTSYGGTSSFVSNAQYRAFGALKHLEYGNGVVMDTTFNSRLQPETYSLGTSSVDVMDKAYQYYPDGRLKHVDDALNWRFDRLNQFDHQGRLQYAKSSSEANGTEITDGWQQIQNLPYRQTNGYNAFTNLTSRYNKQWGGDTNQPITYTFSNDRITSASNGYATWNNYQHDADGRITTSDWPDGISESTYDASGQLVFRHYKQALGEAEDKTIRILNGNGQEEKRIVSECRIYLPEDPEDPCEWQSESASYSLRSTVLGGEVVAAADPQGDFLRGVCWLAERSWLNFITLGRTASESRPRSFTTWTRWV
jgi:YD repeat-containing protein